MLLAALAVTAYGVLAGSGRNVLTVYPVADEGGHFTVGSIADVGLPTIHNTTGHSVRIRSIQPVDLPSGIRVFRIYAYTSAEEPIQIAASEGDMISGCPSKPPYPLTRVVAAPHADSGWQVIIALRVLKPGRYTLKRVRINYVTNGRPGWQYQNIGMILIDHRLEPGRHLPTGECP